MASHNSQCLFSAPNDYMCIYDDELYSIYENLHYHLNDFVTLILYLAVTSILLHVLFIEKEFDSHTLRTSHLSFI